MKESFQTQFDHINQIYHSYDRLYHDLAGCFSLSDSTLSVLYAIDRLPSPCTPKDICDYLFCNKQTVHSSLKSLEAAEYLRIEPSPENHRNRLVFLTEKGRKLTAETVRKVINIEAAAFAFLSEEERETLIRLEKKQLDFFRGEVNALCGKTEE